MITPKLPVKMNCNVYVEDIVIDLGKAGGQFAAEAASYDRCASLKIDVTVIEDHLKGGLLWKLVCACIDASRD